MSTETNVEGLTPERVEDQEPHPYTNEPMWPGQGCLHCGRSRLPSHSWTDPTATIAELRAEMREVEERLREAGQEHDDMMVRLERAEAEVEEAKRNTQWRAVTAVSEENERLAAELERKDAALREIAEWFTRQNPAHKYRECRHCGATWWDREQHNRGCSVPQWSALAPVADQTREPVEACYCTPGVYTPSAMCPVHGATWPDPDEPHAFKMARDCRCYWCGKVSSHAIHRANAEEAGS